MPDWLHEVPAEVAERANALQDQVLDQLRTIIDPDLLKDIVSLGFIKELKIDYSKGSVAFDLELTTPACPVKDVFREQAELLLLQLEWVNTVDVHLTARSAQAESGYAGAENAPKNLAGVSAIVAISSGKGGVGKSSVTVNIGYTLARLGARVGIVDCDVFGPSLPKLIPIENPAVYYYNHQSSAANGLDDNERSVKLRKQQEMQQGEGGMLPVTHNGVKLMSYGYLRPGDKQYAAIRGPMASALVYQMLTQTVWGDLDFLLLDLPPGTGDIHLTVAQSIKLTGHIVVSEPHPLSIVDVRKGLHMFHEVHINPLALIINKAFMTCPSCLTSFDHWSEEQTTREQELQLQSLVEQFGIKFVERLPFSPAFARLRKDTHAGPQFPFVNFCPDDHPVYLKLSHLCENLIREISILRFAGDRAPDLRQLSDGLLRITLKSDDIDNILLVPSREVRLACRCAQCVDEFTHEKKIQERLLPKSICVVGMQQAGNYAMTLTWSDGHVSLMAFDYLEKVARKYVAQKGNGQTCGVEADW
ncbi:MAG: hypothetical protein KVP17_001657 [Porospora cf. gigantea B]|uniref:uncharacterized protein n=1 Tax=Porospora cf. gigantea B TaxID=2853592 RepID=UPI003571C71B|nr:MAG: hypothetical protein KVP17_001657 [Porospora cf. gigantea B]